MNDLILSIGITIIIMLALPFIGKYIIEPYLTYCSKVMGLNDEETR